MNNNEKFLNFIESIKDENKLIIESVKDAFSVCFESDISEQPQELDFDKALAVIGSQDDDFITRLKALLQTKFKTIEATLKELLRPASKGSRKGQLIFVPDAARKIYDIEDAFVQYIIRSIYDNFNDIRHGILFRMHMNEIFSSGFMLEIMKELNEKIRIMEGKKKELKEFYSNKSIAVGGELDKFDTHYRKRIPDNIFNKPESQPFYDKVKEFKAKVKAEHPRVPDETFWKYVRNDYSYSKEHDQIKEDFLKTIPEYVELKEKRNDIWDKEREDIKIMDEQIKEELQKLNYDQIRKVITAMVEFFIKKVSHAVYKNELQFS